MQRASVLFLLALLVIGGCNAPASPTVPVSTATPYPTNTPDRTGTRVPSTISEPTWTAASAATTAPGYLEGRASIGPLVPVERVGVPTPTPSAAVCTARGLTIFRADGKTEVTSLDLQPDCTYRVALPPGTYLVALKQQPGIGGSKDLPRTVAVEGGKTVRLDMSIDTGIR
jgi:hypothetical protein